MLIALRLIKWMIIAAFIGAGIILLLPNFGIDIAQGVQGHFGGNLVIAAVVFIDSLLGRFALSAYALAAGALMILMASFIVFFRV